jgi:hypothetical protein
VALIGQGAHHRVLARANSALTIIGLGACIAIATWEAIHFGRMSYHASTAHFIRACIAIVQRQIRIVCNLNDLTVAIANRTHAVTRHLRSDGRIWHREFDSARAF